MKKKMPAVKAKPAAPKAAKTKRRKKTTATPSPGIRFSTLKISDIVLPEDWNRTELGDISDLVSSLTTEGLLYPILVRKGPPKGKYWAVDGRRRLAAMRQMGITDVPVLISTANNDKDARMQALVANFTRRNNTPYEIALEFNKMVTQDNRTNEEIAQRCGCSPGTVSQHLAVFKADPRLQDALQAKQVPFSLFRQVSKLDQETDKKFYDKIVEKALAGVAAQEVGDLIDKYKTRKAVKAAKEGGSAAKPAKRGAAAHKKNKKAPALNIPDYRSPEIYKKMKPVRKKDMVDWLDAYRERTLKATTKAERTYNMGVLDGLEIATGLLVEE